MKYADLCQQVTNKLIERLEQVDPADFRLPWASLGAGALSPTNATTGVRYRGSNVVHLWLAALDAEYSSGYWATYKQWKSVGAQVRKGEHGATIVKWVVTKSRTNEDNEESKGRLVPKAYAVFAAEQVDGWAPPEAPPLLSEEERSATLDAWINRTAVTVTHTGHRAVYSPFTNVVTLPPFELFTSGAGYYSTALHELVHATGHENRLGRVGITSIDRENRAQYAFEELIAELGASFLCAIHGVHPEPVDDHAQYLASWLKVLRSDPKAIIKAASQAEAAAHWLSDKAGGGEQAAA